MRMTEGVECRKDEDVIDETPMAYKDIDAVMAAQAELVDFVGGHVGCSPRVDVVFVTLLAVGEGGDRQSGASLRGVFLLSKSGERLVRGDHLLINGVGNLLGQALLVL